ncbi:gamma-glutamyltransferase family protein [Marinobacter sediminum]|uniref:gamma-glutamyltransferase family protein n=1 Tax=Marinobacter sediminum TaxID=256323 RepID=UPI00193938CE|nr:gamma-glutamyltransferase [Marinobacter sediminum]
MKASSRNGVICTPHASATDTGFEILRDGGTAIDAVLAASATLAVSYPHMTGIGGDALLMINDGHELKVIMGLGQAGQVLPDGGKICERGPTSAAITAGALRAWQRAKSISDSQWGSRLDWPTLLASAIEQARKGTPVSQSQAFWQHQRGALIAKLPDLQRLCCGANGHLSAEGSTLHQQELGNTLEQLSRAGLDDFYQGEVAEELAQGFKEMGNGLTSQDLANTQAFVGEPLRVRYRNGFLYNFPPPTQGIYTLSALAALNQMPLSKVENGSADYYHCLVEAIKNQLAIRNRELADPRYFPLPLQDRLSDAAARQAFKHIEFGRAEPWQEQGQPADTIWMAASDRQGRTACIMQSLFHDFGSGCMVGNSGVLWSNRAASFRADDRHPNCWAPGKIPAHTLNPSCYLADDGNQWYFGSQGGDGQPQTQMVLATQLIDYHRSIDKALLAPRFLQGRSFFGSSENLKVEQSVPEDVRKELSARGHQVEPIPELSPLTGQAGALLVSADGFKEAMHDPRGQGTARGLD